MAIGVTHFVVLSLLLVAAGIATMLTKRNAIGILIGVELVLNAAAINFVAFNRYAWPSRETAITAQEVRPGEVMHSMATMDQQRAPAAEPTKASRPAIDGQVFAIFIIVLAAAEAAVALAIFLNFYNNFSSIDVEQAQELRG